jgi:hypothetical protein
VAGPAGCSDRVGESIGARDVLMIAEVMRIGVNGGGGFELGRKHVEIAKSREQLRLPGSARRTLGGGRRASATSGFGID